MTLNIIDELNVERSRSESVDSGLIKYYFTSSLLRITQRLLEFDNGIYLYKKHFIDSNNGIILGIYRHYIFYLDERIKHHVHIYQRVVQLAMQRNIKILWNNNLNDYLVKMSVDYTEIQKIDYNSVLKNTLYKLYE